ncbi:hemoglobin [Enhydrobacter aerosaccus]|uniref:Hemoglobin n=2 Tax=Enhydrobacter aerosaccus TaxID=225324 RepID=A0A1T4R8B8_9HYPH|nr:group III truncated hemoglobin [Enhydrobacter aerosaccus]SKA12157.1 hemoglobin [Enhydrobacter aerosaccus]
MNTNLIRADVVAQTGIDEAMIERLVHAFYAKVRQDGLLGPIFDARVRDWDTHLAQMCRFWSSVALATGEYQGNPMIKHVDLPVDARHFDRWLELFEATASEICPPAAATHFVERARRIAQSLELGVALRAGALPARGTRFHRQTPVAAGEGEKP